MSPEINLPCLGVLFCVFFVCLFKEPPYFTAEPESRILAEVEETVDVVCRAMGECGEAAEKQPQDRGTEVAFSRAE